MAEIEWDLDGEREYRTGTDHGAIYVRDEDGDYTIGEGWNGLTGVTESPTGAESTKTYADNIPYLNLKSAEEYAGTIEALMYPDLFARCNGEAEPEPGLRIGQQKRETFGFSWRTKISTDLDEDAGYELHFTWGCDASPTEKAHTTVNDSPEATPFSFEFTTTPVAIGTVGGNEYRPTASMTLDSRTVDPDALAALEEILYGGVATDPRLPKPREIIELFAEATLTAVNTGGANSPSYNSGTHVVTLPAVTGIQWKINGVNKAAGAQPALTVGQVATVTAHPTAGYVLAPGSDDDWVYNY